MKKMQLKKILLAVTCLTAFAAGPACAQMYVGGGVGTSRTDTDRTSWKLYGGAQFNPTWGLELAYTDLGRYQGGNVESLSLAGTATMPLGEAWYVMGKLGVANNRARVNGASSRSDLLVGIGVGYRMTKAASLRLEYEDFGRLSNSNTISNSRGRNLGLSVLYAF